MATVAMKFGGLVRDRKLEDITGPEFKQALKKAGWREAHNGHILKRLRQRGAKCGIETLGDLARAFAKGETMPGEDGASVRVFRKKGYLVFRDKSLITFVDARFKPVDAEE